MVHLFAFREEDIKDLQGARISTTEVAKDERESDLAYINRLFAQAVQERRIELGLSQKQLAQKTRTQLQLIERLERGELNPQLFLLGKILDALNLAIVSRRRK